MLFSKHTLAEAVLKRLWGVSAEQEATLVSTAGENQGENEGKQALAKISETGMSKRDFQRGGSCTGVLAVQLLNDSRIY